MKVILVQICWGWEHQRCRRPHCGKGGKRWSQTGRFKPTLTFPPLALGL